MTYLRWRPEYGMEVSLTSGGSRFYPVWEVVRAGGHSYDAIAVALLNPDEIITAERAAEFHALYAARANQGKGQP